jgi:hypothetical protein
MNVLFRSWRISPRLFALSAIFGLVVQAPANATPSCPAPKLSSQAAVEQYIKRSEGEWVSSVVTNDASVVRRILADDALWVVDGRLLNKTTAVEEAAEGPGPFLSNTLDYVHVRIFDNAAVAQGSETWTQTGGQRGKFIWTATWVNRKGCWQIVNAQDSTVPLPAK